MPDLSRIHNNKSAVPNKIYTDDRGNSFKGASNGRLILISKQTPKIIDNSVDTVTTITIDNTEFIDGGTWDTVYGSDQDIEGGSW